MGCTSSHDNETVEFNKFRLELIDAINTKTMDVICESIIKHKTMLEDLYSYMTLKYDPALEKEFIEKFNSILERNNYNIVRMKNFGTLMIKIDTYHTKISISEYKKYAQLRTKYIRVFAEKIEPNLHKIDELIISIKHCISSKGKSNVSKIKKKINNADIELDY